MNSLAVALSFDKGLLAAFLGSSSPSFLSVASPFASSFLAASSFSLGASFFLGFSSALAAGAGVSFFFSPSSFLAGGAAAWGGAAAGPLPAPAAAAHDILALAAGGGAPAPFFSFPASLSLLAASPPSSDTLTLANAARTLPPLVSTPLYLSSSSKSS